VELFFHNTYLFMCKMFFVLVFVFSHSVCAVTESDHKLVAGLFDKFKLAYSTASDEDISQSLQEAMQQVASEEQVSEHDLVCERDYSSVCPNGWYQNARNRCVPVSYTAETHDGVEFDSMTPQEKTEIALSLNSEFPCRGDRCVQDFEQICPAGWRSDGRVCAAPSSYSGFCVNTKDFNNLGVADRRAWGQFCGVPWPCRRSLENVMKRDAVLGLADTVQISWSSNGQYCKANQVSALRYRCNSVVNLRRLTPAQQHVWASVCGVELPLSCT